MATLTARQIIQARFRGQKNLFTPYVDKIGKLTLTVAYELAHGYDMERRIFWGVSIAALDDADDRALREKLSRTFYDEQDALAHIHLLQSVGKRGELRQFAAGLEVSW